MNVLGGGKWSWSKTHEGLYLLQEHIPDLGKTWRRIGWISSSDAKGCPCKSTVRLTVTLP